MVCISVVQPDLAQLSLDTRTEQSRNLPSLKMTDQAYQSEGDNCSQKKKYSRKELDDLKALAKYKEAFDTFDWNKTSNIATHVSILNFLPKSQAHFNVNEASPIFPNCSSLYMYIK